MGTVGNKFPVGNEAGLNVLFYGLGLTYKPGGVTWGLDWGYLYDRKSITAQIKGEPRALINGRGLWLTEARPAKSIVIILHERIRSRPLE